MLKLVFWLVLAACMVTPAAAHDIPADVRLNIFFKPAGNTLELPAANGTTILTGLAG